MDPTSPIQQLVFAVGIATLIRWTFKGLVWLFFTPQAKDRRPTHIRPPL